MNNLMQLLYEYALGNSYPAYLSNPEYRSLNSLIQRLDTELRQELTDAGKEVLEKYQDALLEQRDTELEALFQAAFALTRELRRLSTSELARQRK